MNRALVRAWALSLGLLVIGVAGLAGRCAALQRGAWWQSYRDQLAAYGRIQAKIAAGTVVNWTPTLPKPPAPLSVTWVLWTTLSETPALAVLVCAVLAMILVGAGRRYVWLPLVIAAMWAGDPFMLWFNDGGQAMTVQRVIAAGVVALALAPLWWASRGQARVVRSVPRPVLVAAAVAVAVPAVVLYAGPHNGNVPQPAAALALLLFGALAAASLPRRLLAAVIAAPVLALPAVGWGLGAVVDPRMGSAVPGLMLTVLLLACISLVVAIPLRRRWVALALLAVVVVPPQFRGALVDAMNGYGDAVPSYVGPVLLTLGLGAFGAGVPLVGPRLLSLWDKALRHGPELSLDRAVKAPA